MERDQNTLLHNENDKENNKNGMKRKFSKFCEDDLQDVFMSCKIIFQHDFNILSFVH